MYVRRDGLYLPTGTADAADLRGHLLSERAVVAVNREHEWVSLAQQAQHDIHLADVAEAAARDKRSRKQRANDAAEDAKLADLYRAAKAAGHRARVRALMSQSAEKRAVRLTKMRTVLLIVGLPVLLAFAGWSTTGVQAGFVKLLDLEKGEPTWWTGWGVEPALITIVAGIIIARAVLRNSGGDTDWRADVIESGALGTSLLLNVVGGRHGEGWAALGAAFGHSLGPVFAASTAYLMGLIDTYISRADPWTGAQSLDDIVGIERGDTRSAEASQQPELPPVAQLDYALPTAQDESTSGPDAQLSVAGKPRKQPSPRPRTKNVAQPAASGYAPGDDPGTRAAQDVIGGDIESIRKAAQKYGVSEGTVRNRINSIKGEGAQPAVPMTPIPEAARPSTASVNGHDFDQAANQ
jgi:hypothetical protein